MFHGSRAILYSLTRPIVTNPNGGYALYTCTPTHFVVKISDGISSVDAAPMLCGGVTVYSSLKNNNCGLGKRVSLGHFTVFFFFLFFFFCKSYRYRKNRGSLTQADADTLKPGADVHIASDDEFDWAMKHLACLVIGYSSSTSFYPPSL